MANKYLRFQHHSLKIYVLHIACSIGNTIPFNDTVKWAGEGKKVEAQLWGLLPQKLDAIIV